MNICLLEIRVANNSLTYHVHICGNKTLLAPNDVITGHNEYAAGIHSPEPRHGIQIEAGWKERVAISLASEPFGKNEFMFNIIR